MLCLTEIARFGTVEMAINEIVEVAFKIGQISSYSCIQF